MQAQRFLYDSNYLPLRLSFQQIPLEVADESEIVLEILGALQSLYPQIAVHTAFLMLSGV
jgi:hypothetical protein